MAGMAPFFLTGASAKIKVNGRTVAFCQDFSYSVTVRHVTPKVLGLYESSSIEPLSYEVAGSFSVIRYVKNLKSVMQEAGFKVPADVSNRGNGIASLGSETQTAFGSDGRAGDNLDPAALKYATFFDIEVYQKTAEGQSAVARIRSCRIDQADFSLSGKAAPAVQRFGFKAIFADEDSFIAGFSGVGQNFA
jgi:hypothetical protein